MKKKIFVLAAVSACVLWGGLSCSQHEDSQPISNTSSTLTDPRDWVPPVFPGAVPDEELYVNMTAVAATPEGLDETACLCFGFPVHDAVFYAYHSDAGAQAVIDFYAEQMSDQGWDELAVDTAEITLPHLVWQQGETGPLVAYLLVAQMAEGRTLIYLSVAESFSPQKVIEE